MSNLIPERPFKCVLQQTHTKGLTQQSYKVTCTPSQNIKHTLMIALWNFVSNLRSVIKQQKSCLFCGTEREHHGLKTSWMYLMHKDLALPDLLNAREGKNNFNKLDLKEEFFSNIQLSELMFNFRRQEMWEQTLFVVSSTFRS